MYGREQYESRRRERFSPPRHEMGHQVKRMRRDWDDAYQHYDMQYSGGRGGGPGPMQMGGVGGRHPGWGQGAGHDAGNMPSHQEFPVSSAPNRDMPDYPTQPPMLTFKQFLQQQDDTIGEEDAIKKFNEYKIDFRRQQISEFFLAHKEEEWFKAKYHPEEFSKKQDEVRSSLQRRLGVFLELMNAGRMDSLCLDVDKSEDILKILDAAVIKMEGGSDFDLTVLDNLTEVEEGTRSRTTSENVPAEKSFSPEKEKEEAEAKKKEEEEKVEEKQKEPEKPLEMDISGEQQELQRKAKEYQQQQQEEKRRVKRKKNNREKSEYSYESQSESDSGSDSEVEPAPPGLEEEPLPPGTEAGAAAVSENGDAKEKTPQKEGQKKKEGGEEGQEGEKDINTKPEEEEEVSRPRPLHRTNSIFLRNLAPTITKQEVEAMCRRYPGFRRVALQDPQPERRFFRRGWVTFSKNVNIKEICWNLNNIRLRDCELGATLNRDLKQRVRPVNGLTVHKTVARNDVRLVARIIQNQDKKWELWTDKDEEKKDEEKDEMLFSFVSKNPVLHNITDYLVEEGSYEEDELLGMTGEEKKDSNSDISVEREDKMLKVLDRMILYLRVVHSIDYYSANEYPNEDEMPHRCGIMHARGMPPGATAKITQTDVSEYTTNFENKLKPFLEVNGKISEEEAVKLGKKNPEAEVEKFVQANTQELAKDKWLCPLSGKKFKGPDFVRKHIFNKHGEKVEEVKKEVAYFNNYLVDPKRPCLPEHPANRPPGPSQGAQHSGGGGLLGVPPSQPPGGMMGYGGRNPPMMYGGNMPPYGGPSFGGRDVRDYGRHNVGSRPYGRRSDPRPIIEYRDLDAPEEMDIF